MAEEVEMDPDGDVVEVFKMMMTMMNKKTKDSEVKYVQQSIDVKMMMKIELNSF